MTTAQGIVLGSPSYFQDVTAEMKALIDRAGFVGLANGRMYKNKIGAALSCFRRSGGMHTIETMNHFFFSNELIIAGRAMSVAREKGEVEKDEEGVQMVQTLGQKIAWMMKKLYD
jgi:multimeric flavodoxin WrbA